MPINFNFTNDKKGIIYRVTGKINGHEFLTEEEKFYKDLDYTKLKYLIIDYSEIVEIDFSIEEIEKLAKNTKIKTKINPNGIIAILTNQKIIKTLTDIWSKFTEGLRWEYKIFEDIASLEGWLFSKLGNEYNNQFISKSFLSKGDNLKHFLENWEQLLNIMSETYKSENILLFSYNDDILELIQKNTTKNISYTIGQKDSLSEYPPFFRDIINKNDEIYIQNIEIENKTEKNQKKHDFVSFYGIPIHYPTGEIFGLLCLLNKEPLLLNKKSRKEIQNLTSIIESQIALKCYNEKTTKYLKEIVDLQILLSNESKTDYLTGLYNRKNFFEISENELFRTRRKKKKLSFIFCDIDHFKYINDNYGHDAGDFIIIYIASLLKSSLRKYDIIWRWGGEEFLIMLPETTLKGAIRIAKKVKTIINRTDFIYKKNNIQTSMSFGLSEIEENENIDDFLKRLDTLLYKAKKSGRDTIIFE